MESEELHTFIRANLRSLWALELLLLMRRERDRSWSADELNRELRGSVSLVQEILHQFRDAGLVELGQEGGYRYRPRTAALDGLVEQLADAYTESPLAVVKSIVAAPNAKIQTLADAFKVKKD